MRRIVLVVALCSLWLGIQAAAWVQADQAAPKVTLKAQDQPVPAVAGQIQNQSGVQIAVAEGTNAAVTVEVVDAEVEDAVRALAGAFNGSWMRAYIIETAPPDPPYTAQELQAALGELRRAWMESLTDEQRQELFGRWRQAREAEMQQAAAQPQPQAGEGQPAQAQPAEGQQAQGQPLQGPAGQADRRDFWRIDDPVRRLRLPVLKETVTLKLDNVPLRDAIYRFIWESGYLVLIQEGVDGTVTVNLQEVPVQDALTQIAAAVGAKCRPFYLVAQPRELTDQEIEARREAGFQQMWAQFWQRPPEERRQFIQQMVDRINRMPVGGDGRGTRRAQRMLSRLTQYSATLDPERRMELKPLIQALGAKLNQ
jgi:hypothetical protein